jgi:hypothetical protein
MTVPSDLAPGIYRVFAQAENEWGWSEIAEVKLNFEVLKGKNEPSNNVYGD